MEQIEESVLKLSNEERRQFVEWFYQHENDLAGPDAYPIHPEMKMLYLQTGRCFFCGELLKEEDASIEHLNPKSRGGPSIEDNEVVCHKSLNQTLGDMDLKSKFSFVLKSAVNSKGPEI